ncbi:MAG: hypothetical protein BGO49_21100 [Planctomycetales bacterium 71-10]|nr:MAG: hypothetical protein BGO49_21100 [Planctomycetales bacterium 71-10]
MLREWLDNPIFVKHLRSRLRPQAMATGASIVALICLCIVYGGFQSRPFDGRMAFAALMGVQFVVLGLVGSVQVGAAVGGAKGTGILDFHRVSPQTPTELTLGFLFGAPIREYLMAALTLPFLLLCAWLGYPDFRGLVQVEVMVLFVAWTLHALSLLGGLVLKGGVTGQNALGASIGIGIFVAGPIVGAFGLLSRLLDVDYRLEFFGFSLPWVAFVVLHVSALLAFVMLAALRKMESERLHGLTKRQALAAMAAFSVLAVGGMGNWPANGGPQLTALYALTVIAIVLISLTTPTQAEYARGLRRARKQGESGPPVLDDAAPNRPIIAAIGTVLLAAGSLIGMAMVDDPMMWRGMPKAASFPHSVAYATIVAAYFGLGLQYFLLRFGRRSANFFGLFLFVAWVLPLILGVVTILAVGPPGNDPRPPLIFSATPIVGIAATSDVFEDAAGPGPALVAFTLALLFAFVFNTLYIKAVRRVRHAVDRADAAIAKPDPDPLDALPAEPAPA